jgi:hypothetical protein
VEPIEASLLADETDDYKELVMMPQYDRLAKEAGVEETAET